MGTTHQAHRHSKVFSLAAMAVGALLALPTLAGCGGLELASMWRDREITVDGMDTEWENTRVYLEDASASVALLNDEEYMYISLVTRDQAIRRQIMGQGFTLWFDPDGGKDKKFGLRFPLGMMGTTGLPWAGREAGDRDTDELSDEMKEAFERATTELEILGPEEDASRRLKVATLKGIEVKANVSDGRLIYELKVPIAATDEHPFAIGAEPGRKIGIGFETPEFDREKMREGMGPGMRGGGGPGGGMPGGGRRGGGMPGGGRRGGQRPEMPKPLDLWAKVQLAGSSDASSQQTSEVVETN